jgi:hypothetical protein
MGLKLLKLSRNDSKKNNLTSLKSNKLTLNQKQVAVYLYVEKNKSETADLLNDEYTEKAIMFGYVMVLKFILILILIYIYIYIFTSYLHAHFALVH